MIEILLSDGEVAGQKFNPMLTGQEAPTGERTGLKRSREQ